MKFLRSIQRQMFDVRPGEYLRTWAMFSYLLSVLFAYYIVKPVSRAMFLTKFDVDKLPSLYILIAIFGGIFAYLYSKLAARTSLQTAVFWAMALSFSTLIVMWWLIRMRLPWMIYVLNIWVSLFSVVTVSQGWLVASNIFDTREAKRIYPLLGIGMVMGAAFGGEFTNRTAELIGTENLLLASAVMVVVAYLSFRLAITGARTSWTTAHAAKESETDFSFGEMIRDMFRVRHLQVIIGMMVVMYIVDTLVEYQFQAMARTSFTGDRLTAFFGHFYGIYLNGVEFLFQLFLTAAVVHWFGVGGTLHISPIAIMLTSVATVLAPGVTSASIVRLTEASTRYTLNKTGMELLYMPLPLELRNRIKAFIDICVDRLSRGLGGILLLALTTTSLDMGVKGLSFVVVGFCIPWIVFSHLARREYVATIRRRLAARRLDLESARITVSDQATVQLLEETARGENTRQATYALSLLAEAPRYNLAPLLQKLAASPAPEVRRKVYELASGLKFDGLLDAAQNELQTHTTAAASAASYVVTVAPDRAALTEKLLNESDPLLIEGALDGLRADRELAQQLLTRDWLAHMATSPDVPRRVLAARALSVRGDQGTEVLHRLLEDADPGVANAACRAAAELRNRAYLFALFNILANPRVRGEAIRALAAYGPAICGTLSDVLSDETVPVRIRRQVPRALKLIYDQRSADVLLRAIKHPDLTVRAAVLKALNHLRENAPALNFENVFVTEQILAEARNYFELSAALATFREFRDGDARASRLLARTMEERLKQTLERLFRLLGLRYPPREIYSAYLAVSKHHRAADAGSALEFLDSVLERDLKRILLPLLDAPENLLERGKELFGLKILTAEDAIRDTILSGDPWLVACAMAAAAELKLRGLAPDIARAAATAVGDVCEVARAAEAALAA